MCYSDFVLRWCVFMGCNDNNSIKTVKTTAALKGAITAIKTVTTTATALKTVKVTTTH